MESRVQVIDDSYIGDTYESSLRHIFTAGSSPKKVYGSAHAIKTKKQKQKNRILGICIVVYGHDCGIDRQESSCHCLALSGIFA